MVPISYISSTITKTKTRLWLFNLILFKILTARVRSMREGNIYTWECLSVHHWCGGGTPSQVWGDPISGLGGTPSKVWMGGTLSQVWGVPHPRSGWWGGGGYLIPGLAWGYPIPGLDRRVPHPSERAAAGGMPLAFTQEDFLVTNDNTIFQHV